MAPEQVLRLDLFLATPSSLESGGGVVLVMLQRVAFQIYWDTPMWVRAGVLYGCIVRAQASGISSISAATLVQVCRHAGSVRGVQQDGGLRV